MIEEGLVTFLKAQAPIAVLISGRVFPGVIPLGQPLPALTYQRISCARVRSFAGASGIASPRFQIDAWASTAKTARELAGHVRRALDGYRGSLGQVQVLGVQLDGDQDRPEPELQRFAVFADYLITHRED